MFESPDRAFANPNWFNEFVNFNFHKILIFFLSNHSPILLHCNNTIRKKKNSFKFEVIWLNHPDFKRFVEDN